ncbi:MAG: hypothetical protein JSW55_16730 [Chloroflexota bacterium]|nr:MAG: hypothetical protein JSW55_16730 [Chloroflexota bacterium]
MIEPTAKQCKNLSRTQGEVALAQFFAVKDRDAFERYLNASGSAVSQHDGRRRHQCHIDQILAGGSMAYDAVLVDTFPSGESALQAFDANRDERAAAVVEAYILVVKPAGDGLFKAARYLGVLSPIVSRILGTTSERPLPEDGKWNPNTGPVPETIASFKKDDQTTPFFMMNLNKYYTSALYTDGENISGERAYARYANRIMPYLISVGGYPALMGQVAVVFAGDETSPLHDEWSEFAMVYYPSRQVFLRMMTNSPTKGVHHREAGLERAVLMPSTEWPLA